MKEIIIKKPKQKRSQAKFLAILQACPRVLQDEGYKKTTTARLALEADVSIGSLYDYFSCKEAVFIAYLDYALNEALDEVEQEARYSTRDTLPTLKTLVQVGVDFAFEQREILKVVFTEFPTMLDKIDLADSREKVAGIALLFATRLPANIDENKARLMIYSLTNIVLGFQFRIALMPDEGFEREQIVEQLFDIVSGYLQAEFSL